MTECRSPELQDLLPDYVADALDEVTTARLTAHLESCAVCADDLAVLQLVRRVRPRVAVPDVARIVAALPPSPALRPSERVAEYSGPRLVRDTSAGHAATPLPPSLHAPRKRGAVFGLSVWRLAATLGVVIAGGASVLVARHGVIGGQDPAVALQMGESAMAVPDGLSPDSGGAMASAHAPQRAPVSVSYGDLGDYSEDELQNMLDRLENWDGAASTEPLPGVPILLASGGSTP
jgi:hypothetical protein